MDTEIPTKDCPVYAVLTYPRQFGQFEGTKVIILLAEIAFEKFIVFHALIIPNLGEKIKMFFLIL